MNFLKQSLVLLVICSTNLIYCMNNELKINIRPKDGKCYKANIQEVSQEKTTDILKKLTGPGTVFIFNYTKEELSKNQIREILTYAHPELLDMRNKNYKNPITYYTEGLDKKYEETLRKKLADNHMPSFFTLALGRKLKNNDTRLPKPTQVILSTFTEIV